MSLKSTIATIKLPGGIDISLPVKVFEDTSGCELERQAITILKTLLEERSRELWK